MRIRSAQPAELERVAGFVAAQQADGRSHIAYLGTEPESVARDLRGLEPLGVEGLLVAVEGDRLLGALGADWDRDPPRVWWHGPFAVAGRWDEVADGLLAAGGELLPGWVTEQELAADDRNERVAALARRHGFDAEEASVVLRRRVQGARAHTPLKSPRILPWEELTQARRAAVAALHDRLFAGGHLPGRKLADGDDRVVLAALDARVVGYVVAERQSDGNGYIDFIGVEPSARGAGVGRALVEAACAFLAERHGCPEAHLTVRESLEGARRLYERCGFSAERVLRPWRQGFSLASA